MDNEDLVIRCMMLLLESSDSVQAFLLCGNSSMRPDFFLIDVAESPLHFAKFLTGGGLLNLTSCLVCFAETGRI